MNGPRIRRQVYALDVADLAACAVWEFALDEEGEEGQDEATVRPCAPVGALDPAGGMYVVRARLQLADGTCLAGYLTPPIQGDASLGTLQPAAVLATGQVTFWCGMLEPDPALRAATYACLGKTTAADVFPIRFESDVDLIGGRIEGEIPGFVVLEDFRTGRTRVVL